MTIIFPKIELIRDVIWFEMTTFGFLGKLIPLTFRQALKLILDKFEMNM